jgi:hypothetical protein
MQRIVNDGWRLCRIVLVCLLAARALPAAEPFLEKTNLFTEATDGFRLYRIPGIVSHPGTASRPRPFLLFSNPDTTQREHKERVNVTIKLSEDGGRTWPVSKVLQSGPSAYSDLAVLPDGTVLCFYESGDPQAPRKHGRPWAYAFLTLARFHPDWLTSTESATCLLDHGLHE